MSRLAVTVVAGAAGLAVFAPSGVVGLGAGEAYACAGAGANPGNIAPAAAQRAVICLINKRRANRNRPAVRVRNPLRSAAKQHTRRMRNTGCFGHNCGGTLRQRLHRTSYLPCNCTWGAGETIAWGADARAKPRRIVKSWLNSQQHRQILLSAGFRHIGVGVVWGSPLEPNNSSHGTYTAILGFKQ